MYGPRSLLCLGDEMNICDLVPFFSPPEIMFPIMKGKLWVKTTLLIIKRPNPLKKTNYRIFR